MSKVSILTGDVKRLSIKREQEERELFISMIVFNLQLKDSKRIKNRARKGKTINNQKYIKTER